MIFRFLHIWFLLLLLAIPLMIRVYRLLEKSGRPRILFPDLGPLKKVRSSPLMPWRHLPIILRLTAVGLLIIGLARPQSGVSDKQVLTEGIDIMIVLDVSTSMSTNDFEPSRLAVAKLVVSDFIAGRLNDRIGIVVFSAIAFTQCPLTLDYGILQDFVEKISFSRKEHDGTAIGLALATALNRLRDSKAESKVVILVTDGENNKGIDPLQAARLAESLGVKVYPIGVVNPEGLMKKQTHTLFGSFFQPTMPKFDDTQLREIAKVTKGKFFRVSDPGKFVQVFKEIDEMEKTEVEVKEYYRYSEKFLPWVILAGLLIGLEILLSLTRFRRIP